MSIQSNGTARQTTFYIAVVEKVSKNTKECVFHLDNGESLSLPPFHYINEGEQLQICRERDKIVSICKIIPSKKSTTSNQVKLFPQYNESEIINIPPHTITVRFRERQNSKDLEAIKLLEQFHYRGNGLNKIVGRRTVLLAEAEGIGIIGYGVISATVLACKPRFELFKVNLKKQMECRLINQLARIPRVVVHPEYRGLGIGSKIAKHLVQFAAEHWDIKGYKPVMIEVIASMTQYHKFFEIAGFINAGTTAGKATIFKPTYGKGGWEERPNSNNYKFFGPLGPKPYLVFPLTQEVKNLIIAKQALEPNLNSQLNYSPPLLKQSIEFREVSVNYVSRNRRTERSTEVKTVFGVDYNQLRSPVLHNLNLIIEPGDVVLATGASGSGKSTLLKLLMLDRNKTSRKIRVSGTISGLQHSEIAVLPSKWNNKLPLVDQLGNTLEESIALLNSVGLAEAHLYLKTPNQISEGQRYRFSIAYLCNSRKPVWIADEFTSTLDPYTAAVVAKGIRKQAASIGATLIVAAPHTAHFAQSLIPTQIVRLQWGGIAHIFSIRLQCEQNDGYFRFMIINRTKFDLTNIKLVASNSDGDFRELAHFPKLEGFQTEEIEVLAAEIDKITTVRVTTTEEVGDIIFFK